MRGGNKNSGRRSVIDMRADRRTIIKDLVLKRKTHAEIAKQIGVHTDTVSRYNQSAIPEELRRSIMAEARIQAVEADTEVINQDRMDVATTYESLAKRVERLITKAEEGGDDGFALAAMDGLRKVMRDIAQLQGKLATSLTVNVSLAESKEWVTLRGILNDVIAEVPEAREPLLRRIRHEVLSVTKEESSIL